MMKVSKNPTVLLKKKGEVKRVLSATENHFDNLVTSSEQRGRMLHVRSGCCELRVHDDMYTIHVKQVYMAYQ